MFYKKVLGKRSRDIPGIVTGLGENKIQAFLGIED